MPEDYRTIKVPMKLVDMIGKMLDKDPDFPYRSLNEFCIEWIRYGVRVSWEDMERVKLLYPRSKGR